MGTSELRSKLPFTLHGIYPPLTTPFDRDGAVALDALAANIHLYNQVRGGGLPLAGYVVLGSTGEASFLRESEKIAVLESAAGAATYDKLLIAGTGEESVHATVELSRRAAEIGYQAVLVRTPHYFKPWMHMEAQKAYYRAVADASPVPVLLYNFPRLMGVDLSPETVLELAQHPNIIGIKESSGNLERMRELVELLRSHDQQDFLVISGSAGNWLPALQAGVSAGIVALAVAAPGAVLEVSAAFEKGDIAAAQSAQQRISAAAAACAELGPVGAKYSMDLQPPLYGGPARLPLLPLSAEQQQMVQQAFSGLLPAAAAIG